ncbi:MAG: hypothetical protein GXO47_09125, partial [Chlorobi bacterium]|nr:hypothetical protein [Chlorobiota bacterium]
MKKETLISIIISIAAIYIFGTNTYSQDEKTPVKSSAGYSVKKVLMYNSTGIGTLNIRNKHGNISIDGITGSDSVRIAYEINVGSFVEEAAYEVINQIKINDFVSEKTLYIKTLFQEDFQSAYDFSVNYHIWLPENTNIVINNEFGDLNITGVADEITINAGYGNIA